MRTLMKKGRLALTILVILGAFALPPVTDAATTTDSGLGDTMAGASVYVPEGLPLILLGTGLAAVVLVAWRLRARKRSRKP